MVGDFRAAGFCKEVIVVPIALVDDVSLVCKVWSHYFVNPAVNTGLIDPQSVFHANLANICVLRARLVVEK